MDLTVDLLQWSWRQVSNSAAIGKKRAYNAIVIFLLWYTMCDNVYDVNFDDSHHRSWSRSSARPFWYGQSFRAFFSDTINWPTAGCKFADFLDDVYWIDLSGKHYYRLHNQKTTITMDYKRTPTTKANTKYAFRCVAIRKHNQTINEYTYITHSSHVWWVFWFWYQFTLFTILWKDQKNEKLKCVEIPTRVIVQAPFWKFNESPQILWYFECSSTTYSHDSVPYISNF